MNRTADLKYPHSASLFRFCRMVLDHKFEGARVIDQDIGQILGFDPADCSHWKKGKKNIRSIQAIKSIAQHLDIDERLIIEIAFGEVDELEAFLEYSGYGLFQVSAKTLEEAKKVYYKKLAASWTKNKENDFMAFFEPRHELLDGIASRIHEKIHFEESPLYLPELIAALPPIKFVSLEKEQLPEGSSLIALEDGGQLLIKCEKGKEIKPYMRFMICREIAKFLLKEYKKHSAHLEEYADENYLVECNLLAAKLLCPAPMVRREIAKVSGVKDIVSQLAENFWVSKSFMNRLIKYVIEKNPAL